MNVATQTIVVTGSTRGIGRGLAAEFLRRGHQVVVSGRRPDAVSRAVQELGAGAALLGQTCDVRDLGSVQALWDAAVSRFGRVDMWINNAAIATDRMRLDELPGEQMVATVDTNLIGTLFGCKVALAGMLKQGSGQVFTFEGFGSDGMTSPGLCVYGSTKRAIRYLTEGLAKEYRGSPVLIGSLSPGIVPTDLLIYSSRSQDAQEWARAKRMMNILGDKVETVTPWLAEQALANREQGANIAWLTRGKAALRFMTAPFNKRDIVSEFEQRGDLVVR